MVGRAAVMTANPEAEEAENALRALAHPGKARTAAKYFKTDPG